MEREKKRMQKYTTPIEPDKPNRCEDIRVKSKRLVEYRRRDKRKFPVQASQWSSQPATWTLTYTQSGGTTTDIWEKDDLIQLALVYKTPIETNQLGKKSKRAKVGAGEQQWWQQREKKIYQQQQHLKKGLFFAQTRRIARLGQESELQRKKGKQTQFAVICTINLNEQPFFSLFMAAIGLFLFNFILVDLNSGWSVVGCWCCHAITLHLSLTIRFPLILVCMCCNPGYW